jgi:hypothetical protein
MAFPAATTRIGDVNSGKEPVMKTTERHTGKFA